MRTDAAAPPARDPGLQPERTVLAWSRTALALFVNALLALRSGLLYDEREMLVLGCALLVAAAWGVAMGARRRHQLLQIGRDPRPSSGALLTTVAIAWLASLTALGSVLLHLRTWPPG